MTEFHITLRINFNIKLHKLSITIYMFFKPRNIFPQKYDTAY